MITTTDHDVVTLTGTDSGAIGEALEYVESAVCTLLNEIHAARAGAIIDKKTALEAVLVINWASHVVEQTLQDAKSREPVA